MMLESLTLAALVANPFLTKIDGSCAEGNLSFQTFRVSKIPLPSEDQYKREARFLVYMNEDGSYKARYTENIVLSCTTGPQGESCQLKPIKTEKFEGQWSYQDNIVSLSELGSGEASEYNGIPILKFHFDSVRFPNVSGQDKTGWMVKINLDQNNRTAESYCATNSL